MIISIDVQKKNVTRLNIKNSQQASNRKKLPHVEKGYLQKNKNEAKR